MMRRPPGEGRHVAQQRKYLFAFAVFLLPWLQLVDAQQQQQQPRQQLDQQRPLAQVVGSDSDRDAARARHESPLEGDRVIQNLASTALTRAVVEPPLISDRRKNTVTSNTLNDKHIYDNVLIPEDASALATLAPDQSVRAPSPPRYRPGASTAGAKGLSSQQSARNLEDWEVEDFVLLATVDGDLYASDRKTGKERWHLEVEQPMVETRHYRVNSSALDDDYREVDHYIWAVEPNRDGGLYLWIPGENGAGLIEMGLTMKRLVEELAPHSDKDRHITYTGDKKTTLVTLEADTGRVLKWFGSSGSQVNEAESCLRPNALVDLESEECSNSGTITLGRTEYIVGIHRADGRTIATLKYSEWGPNTYDNDLLQQYGATMDNRYITGQPDGKFYSFDYARSGGASPVFAHKLSSPVARVFDVVRPWASAEGSNPELVVLPQPPPPEDDAEIARRRSTSIFLNQTEAGSWYAMSGLSYPLILDAPMAQVSRREWWDKPRSWDSLNEAQLTQALIGTHFLEAMRGRGGPNGRQTLPGDGTISHVPDDRESDPTNGSSPPAPPESTTLIEHAKKLPQVAANSVVDFISNPVLILLFVFFLFYYQKDLRRWYNGGSAKAALLDSPIEVGPAETAPESAVDLKEVPRPEEVVEEKVEISEPDKGQVSAGEASDKEPSPAPTASETAEDGDTKLPDLPDGTSAPEKEKKKKAHRGRRGGVKHKKAKDKRDLSQSRDDDPPHVSVEEAVNNAKKLGEQPRLEPDVLTVTNDVEEVSGPILKMGSLEVNEDQQLGTGSNGTVVFAGRFDGRDVAVKRMLIQFYDIASQETRLLRESDDHPNVIRYFAQQQRAAFLYIALELCQASLADVVEKPHIFRDLAQAGERDLPNVLYQITNGLSHLHSLRIVHRDLKPQNILVNMGKDGRPRLLVSDFGLCKKLEGGQSSFGATTAHAAGTSGWRAPELLLDDDARDGGATLIDASTHSGSGSNLVSADVMPNRRATRAIDIFSLGLVFFYVLTKGSHPFDCGDRYMREVNIRKGNYNLGPLDVLGDFAYEARDLVSSMLSAKPTDRPTARDVMGHPFFWSAKKRLAFLCDVSDHFEKEPRDPPSWALTQLENWAGEVIPGGDFLRPLPKDFVDSLGKQRKYTGGRLLDLLRALRNKRNHYEDMPEALKKTVGPLPEGYLGFWTRKFPQLLLVCWNVVYQVRWDEADRFREYYEPAGL